MRHAIIACPLIALAVFALACSGNVAFNTSGPAGGSLLNTPREALVEKDLALLEAATTVLKGVTDPVSLNNAKPKLTVLVNQHNNLKADLQRLGPTTLQETKVILQKFGDRSKATKQNLSVEMTRVNSTIPGGDEVYRQLLDLWQGL